MKENEIRSYKFSSREMKGTVLQMPTQVKPQENVSSLQAEVLNPHYPLESSGDLAKIPMPKLRPLPIKSESLKEPAFGFTVFLYCFCFQLH